MKKNERPLHVVFLTPEYPPDIWGGLATHVRELSDGMVAAGHRVTVFAFNMGPKIPDVIGPPLTIYRIKEHGPPPAGLTGYGTLLHIVDTINQDVLDKLAPMFASENDRPDVVHCHDWFWAKAMRALTEQHGVRCVYTAHTALDPVSVWCGDAKTDPLLLDREDRCLSTANTVITVSDSMRGILRDLRKVPDEKIRVVYNAMDPTPFLGVEPEAKTSDERYVVFAGRMVKMKGIAALLCSAAEVLAMRPNVTYLIATGAVTRGKQRLTPPDPALYLPAILAGSKDLGIHEQEVLELDDAAKERLRAKVKFIGWQSREALPVLYAKADLALVPSLYEPFGYAALEAMAAGVPIVASRAGGLAEFIEDGVNGLLVPVVAHGERRQVDIAALTAAQLRLLDDPTFARGLGRAARTRAKDFSMDRMLNGTLAVYRDLLA